MTAIGFDTSNYTTSVAAYDGRNIISQARLLDVPEGALRNQLCGYVSQEADGWHVQVVGTGW